MFLNKTFWIKGLLAAVALFTVVSCGDKSSNSVNNNNNINDNTNVNINDNINNNINDNINDNTNNNNNTCEIDLPSLDQGYFVSPSGSETAAGAENDPLDLATSFSSESPAQPGDTIYLMEGTYQGRFNIEISGSVAAPIVIKPYPGQRVTIDGNGGEGEYILNVSGDYLQIIGLEITDSDTNRVSSETGSSPSDINLGGGLGVFGEEVVIANCVIHDTAQGISFWTPSVNSTLHGNLIYNNGWNAPDRGHGHAIYTQNLDGTKTISNNVIYYGFSFGVHAYTEGGSIQGFDVIGNVWFLNGASVPDEGGIKDNCLVGGLQPVARTLLEENMGWAPSPENRSVRFGYGGNVDNIDFIFNNNYQIGGLSFQGNWETGTIEDNTIYGSVSGADMENDFPNNIVTTELPQSEQTVFLRPNQYDANQTLVVIYNWENTDQVTIDLSSQLTGRHQYTVHHVFDRFGSPVVSGTYNGSPITLPMGTVPPPQPNGLDGTIVPSEDPGVSFGAFILTHHPCKE